VIDISPSMVSLIFFFRAEDGIRDFHVTGVQTCALPISSHPRRAPRTAGADGTGSGGGPWQATLVPAGEPRPGSCTSPDGECSPQIGRASCRERVELPVVEIRVRGNRIIHSGRRRRYRRG